MILQISEKIIQILESDMLILSKMYFHAYLNVFNNLLAIASVRASSKNTIYKPNSV